MENFADMIWPAIWQGLGLAAESFVVAFVSNPWPFLGIGALAVVSALVPRAARR